jgi:hypothetical protein
MLFRMQHNRLIPMVSQLRIVDLSMPEIFSLLLTLLPREKG